MSVTAYPKYKDSGVAWLGDVPSHWDFAPFKRLVEIQNGSDYKHVEQGDGYPVIGSGGAFTFASDYLYDGESVLLGRKGTVDKPLHVTGRFWTVDTMYWSKIRPGIIGRFAYYTALTIPFSYYTTSTALPSMTQSALNSHPVVVPPAAEQTAIVIFLDRETAKIDGLVAEQERLIALLKEKRQAVISHAVTKGLNPNAPMKDSGIECLGQIPAHWDYGPLKRYWSVTDCKHITAEFVTDGYPLASIREVQSQFVNFDGAKQTTFEFFDALREGNRDPRPGDLVFSRNATVGEVAQVHADHPPFAMGQDVCLLRKLQDTSSSDFVQVVLKSSVGEIQMANLMIGSTFKRINVEEIRNLVVPFPAPGEQNEISEHVGVFKAKADSLIAEAQAAINLLQERRAALISAAITGKIDARVDVSSSNVIPIEQACAQSNLPALRVVVGAYPAAPRWGAAPDPHCDQPLPV